ncbi:hypothetical protein Fmac_010520 [Flemingia macrophylla]|uniref:Uncharacterized protein n=1 Tax=Flemingia macrophylla TaxID=520843 RepID=A0ABD1MJU4_9FABA
MDEKEAMDLFTDVENLTHLKKYQEKIPMENAYACETNQLNASECVDTQDNGPVMEKVTNQMIEENGSGSANKNEDMQKPLKFLKKKIKVEKI